MSAEAQVTQARNNRTSSLLKNRQSLAGAEASVANAQLSATASAGNNIKLAPAKASDIATAQATVDLAAAAVATAEETVLNTTLTAIIDGTVTAMNLVLG